MSHARLTLYAAVVLACAAGAVDAIGYLTLAHLFTAHMSGNSAALGAALGRADLPTVAQRVIPIGIFLLGVTAGAVAAEVQASRGARHPFLPIYALEMVLLVAFGILAENWAPDGMSVDAGLAYFVLAGCLTLAMGFQNATLKRVESLGVHTTYVTGVLTSLADALAHALMQRRHGGPPPPVRMRVYSAIWAAYIAGAALASFAQSRWSYAALGLPIAALGLVFILDARHSHEIGQGPL